MDELKHVTVEIDANDLPTMRNALDGKACIRVAHSFQVRLDDLSAMSGESVDTIVRIDGYPDPQAVALIYFAAKQGVLDVDEFEAFRDDLERDTGHRIQEIIDKYPAIFKDPEKALRFVFSGPKRVHGVPPLSRCQEVYENQPADATAAHLKAKPRPLYCLDCGQRFQYDKVGRLKCSDELDVVGIANDLVKKASQPSLDDM